MTKIKIRKGNEEGKTKQGNKPYEKYKIKNSLEIG